MDRRDPHGYYQALKVSPDASSEEIRLSYEFLKQAFRERRAPLNIGRIQAAYEALRDPALRDRYDRGVSGSEPPPRPGGTVDGPSRLGTGGILLALLFVLVTTIGIVYHENLRAALTWYSAGDVLYSVSDGRRFGTVIRYESDHRFPNGALASAYLVEEPSQPEPVWYPAHDLERLCRR